MELGPDFIVTSVSGSASTTTGQPITVTATVCNQGTRAESADVEFLLSQDEVITPSTPPSSGADFHIGFARSDMLMPGQCQTVTVPAYAGESLYDSLYVGAFVDPSSTHNERREDNNTWTGGRIDLQP